MPDRQRFLLTSRPAGKVYAGYWEFPGGKFEPGETLEQALRRELHEELGITIGAVHPGSRRSFDYPHARVRLHFCKVYDWPATSRCAKASRWPGSACRWQVRRCCPAPCRCCAGSPPSAASSGPTH
jgi:8-oxo-dGTP diphosphatase